jgi:hypothetical protein
MQNNFMGFFLTQPNLRILKVEWNGPELNTSGISPGLQVLHGNRGTMNAFFPRRGNYLPQMVARSRGIAALEWLHTSPLPRIPSYSIFLIWGTLWSMGCPFV